MSGERVLVTGARGYLGGRLMQALPDAVPFHADLRNDRDVAKALESCEAVDTIIHLAAANEIVCANDFERGVAINCFGTRNLFEAVGRHGIRRALFFSTFHVYGPVTDGAILTESSPVDPVHPYGMTKLMGEQLCKAARSLYGFDLAIFRLSNAVGAPAGAHIDRWSLLMLDLCRQAHEKRALALRSSGSQQRDFVSIHDVAEAVRIVLAAEAPKLEDPVFNLGSGCAVRVRDIAAWIQEEYQQLYGERLPISFGSDNGASNFSVSIEKLARLGFQPKTDLRREIRETLRFCEQFRAVRT
jgi:UDP-glucose 4-epimerase